MNTMRIRLVLLFGLVLALAVLLAACGGNPPATPTPTTGATALPPTATATQQPTVAPTATAMPTSTSSPTPTAAPSPTATTRPTATVAPPATPTAVTPTATPAVPPTPTPVPLTLGKVLDNLGNVNLDLQGPPALGGIEGLDAGNISLPQTIVSVPDLNLDLSYDAIYSVTTPAIPSMPSFPQIPGIPNFPGQ